MLSYKVHDTDINVVYINIIAQGCIYWLANASHVIIVPEYVVAAFLCMVFAVNRQTYYLVYVYN